MTDPGSGARWRRLLAGRPAALAVLVTAVALLGLSPAALAANRVDGVLPNGWTDTPTGPLSPADRDLLERVRLAGLWETPAGQMAEERAASPRVKVIGHHIATEHLKLDELVREAAGKLGVALPDRPNADQQRWLDVLAASQGAEFDRAFTELLRDAHGKVFTIVAEVRSSTQNDTMRAVAQTGIEYVMRHMTYLESTGLVEFAELPAAVPELPGPQAPNLFQPGSNINPALIWMVLAIALVVGLVSGVRVIRPR
jgi:predicted outer membrane protein